MSQNVLIFGAGGALGESISTALQALSWQVFTAGRPRWREAHHGRHTVLDYAGDADASDFRDLPELHGVVWAHGLNASDSISAFDSMVFAELWQANVALIASSMAALLRAGKLGVGSKLCVISSIWQLESRLNKLSYTVSKAALQGLVKSCALDLGERGILINAVLPGVVETPMTRKYLSADQIECIIQQTAMLRLAEPVDIAAAVAFLIGPSNRVITGQSLIVDGGFLGLRRT
jgi:NAD(P)-dependent dehydrogenase (short-subunit alcohol dehydrogenase family)